MLTLACPTCGFVAGIEVFAGDLDARAVAQLMGQVPRALADDVLRYIALFAPPKHKVTISRARKHLEPLVATINAGSVSMHQRVWAAPESAWSDAFSQLQAKRAELVLPLKSHIYLYKIVAGIADKAEAQAESDIEQQRRHGYAPPAAGAPPDPAEGLRRRALVELQQQRATRVRLNLAPLTAEQEAAILANFKDGAS